MTCEKYSSHLVDSPDSPNKRPRSRRFYLVLARGSAARLLAGKRQPEKKQLLASAGLLLHPADAREQASPHEW